LGVLWPTVFIRQLPASYREVEFKEVNLSVEPDIAALSQKWLNSSGLIFYFGSASDAIALFRVMSSAPRNSAWRSISATRALAL
jgi:hypothetical protein